MLGTGYWIDPQPTFNRKGQCLSGFSFDAGDFAYLDVSDVHLFSNPHVTFLQKIPLTPRVV